MRDYAEAGGRVVVCANAFFVGTVRQANAVLGGYGLEIASKEAVRKGQNDVTLDKNDLHTQLVKEGIESANFFRASPVKVTDEKAGRVLANAAGVGDTGDAFIAAAKAGKGEVIAIGQSLWWHWMSKERAKGTDNAKLLRWLLATRRGV